MSLVLGFYTLLLVVETARVYYAVYGADYITIPFIV